MFHHGPEKCFFFHFVYFIELNRIENESNGHNKILLFRVIVRQIMSNINRLPKC